MTTETVAIKGSSDGLLVALDPDEEWLTVTGNLAAKIDEQSAFFEGARIIIDVGTRPVPKYELSGLKALLERRGLTFAQILSDSATTTESANALDIRTGASSEEADNDALPISPEEIGEQGVFLRRTLRSGRTVHTHGSVVIIGDVNPGAEVIAGGDVIIWGRLRGNVHAGADGDETAIVCALHMMPTQLRIAGFITTSPPDKRAQSIPEVALIRDEQIVVEAWKQ